MPEKTEKGQQNTENWKSLKTFTESFISPKFFSGSTAKILKNEKNWKNLKHRNLI